MVHAGDSCLADRGKGPIQRRYLWDGTNKKKKKKKKKKEKEMMLYKKWRGTTDQTDGQTDRKRRPPPPPGKEFIVQSAKNNKDADTIIYFVVCQWPSTNDWCKTRRVQATSRTRRRIEAIFTVVPCALVQKQINRTKERRDSSGKELSASASRKRQQQQTSIECIKRERMRRVKRSGAIRSSRLPLGIRRKSYSTVTTKKEATHIAYKQKRCRRCR